MTRPMPGPPEYCCCRDGDQPCGLWLDGGADLYPWYPRDICPGCILHNGRSESHDKRLTTPECAAHEWQADAELERAARNLDDDYYNPHRFRLRAEYERRLDEWDTWVEFTLRPHALEEA